VAEAVFERQHYDRRPFDERGTREYNLASASAAPRRSRACWCAGHPVGAVKTISYGKERPIVVGSNEEAYAQNRVGITIVNGG